YAAAELLHQALGLERSEQQQQRCKNAAHYPTAFARTSFKRRATIASSPGCSIQTPTTIVFSSVCSPAPGRRPVCGLSSMLGVPLRSSPATSSAFILTLAGSYLISR